MVRIINYAPKPRPNDSDNEPLYDEERPRNSATAEDTIDNLLAGLTHRPDIAQSGDALPDAASPDDTLPYVMSADVASNGPKLARLPSVEEFRFDEAAARSMASKLAPNQKPRIKSRRPRYRSPHRDRWRFPGGQFADEHDEQNDDSWDLPPAIAAPRRNGRSLVWSFGYSILIVIGAAAAFGFVQPLNGLLPERIGVFLSDISEDLSASLFDRTDTSADIQVAGDIAASVPPPVSPGQRLASAAVARPVSTTTVRAEIQPPANSGGSAIAEQREPPGATSEKAFELGATVLNLGNIDSAEFATSKSAEAFAAAPPAAPVAAPSKAPAAAEAGIEENPRKPALRKSVRADPFQTANTAPAATPEPAANEPQLVSSNLSAAQINHLLARGEELLQSGDIASARLLFLRVAEAGDRRGAVGVGMTYDPNVYARLPVAGLTPDREQAEFWYKRARDDSMFTTGSNPVFTPDTNPVSATDRDTVGDTQKAQEPGSPEWNAACARKYNSFQPSTGLYTALSGATRPCRLP